MVNLGNLWDFSFMWDTFAFLLKVVAPFLMIVIAVLAVGALLYIVVGAVKQAVQK